MIPKIEKELCNACERCKEVCPVDAIDVSLGFAKIEEEFCEECGMCVAACPSRAIVINFPVFEVN